MKATFTPPDSQGFRRFTCTQCGKTFQTKQTHVRQWSIDKWWQMVAQMCANCRVERQGEPAQGGFHAGGRDTETQAAASIAPRSGTLRKEVLHLLKEAGRNGLTDDEGGALMHGDRLTFGRRRHELVKAGLVRDSGARRPTPAGKKAVVWELV